MIYKNEGKQGRGRSQRRIKLNFNMRNELRNKLKIFSKTIRPEEKFSAIIFVMAIFSQVSNVAP